MADAPRRAPVVVILGATGRLGRAMARRATHGRVTAAHPAPVEVRGLARHPAALAWPGLVSADRHDTAAVRRLIDGCDAVVDLCAFNRRDADSLLAAWRACATPPRRLVFASSLAERSPRLWASPVADLGLPASSSALPSDDYGAGKRAARARYESALADSGVAVISLLFPQVLAVDDPAPREARYVTDARAMGHALLPGTGEQRPCLITADTAAEIAWRCALDDRFAAVAPLAMQVAPSRQPPLHALVTALLRGADLPPRWRSHPDASWRGPHAGGDEQVDASRLRAHLPDLDFGDLLAAYRALGARLDQRSDDSAAPC